MDLGKDDAGAPSGALTSALQQSHGEDPATMSFLDAMLHDACKSGQSCSIYLVNGIKLQGKVLGVDAQSLAFTRIGQNQVPFGVNRAAIATFLPDGADNPGMVRPRRP